MAEFRNFDQLERYFNAVPSSLRGNALKAAFRKSALKVRRATQKNLSGSGIGNTSKLKGGIRYSVREEGKGLKEGGLGFIVTVKPARKRGYHVNRYGKRKPVLLWLESSKEAERRTKENGGRRALRKRKQHRTGIFRRFGFMRKTKQEILPAVEADLKKSILSSFEKMAKKYGGT